MLTKYCVSILHGYRSSCGSQAPAGQLLLPEALKFLPLYVSAVRKMPAYRSDSSLRVDERVSSLFKLLVAPVALSSVQVYPRVYPVSCLEEQAGCGTGVGSNVHLPHTVASSHERLAEDAVYLIDNGVALTLYVSGQVHPDTLQRIFGVSTCGELPQALARGQQAGALVSEDFSRVYAIVQQLRNDRHRLPWMPLNIMTPDNLADTRRALFVEDRDGEMRYTDFLCQLHRLVQNKT